MTEIINLTSHIVSLLCEADDFETAEVLHFYPHNKVPVRTQIEQAENGMIEYKGKKLIVVQSYLYADLPNQKEGVYYIVSSLVSQCNPKRKDLIVPDTGPTCVKDQYGRVVTVRRFQQWVS